MKRAFFILLVFLLVIPFSAFAQEGTTVEAVTVYRSEDGAYVAILPEGWVADGSRDGLRIGNSQETLDMMGDEEEDIPASGQIGVSIIAFDIEELTSELELAEDATEVDILTSLIELFASEDNLFGEAEAIEFDDRPAATITGMFNESTEGKIYLHHIAEGTMALSSVGTPVGELDAALEEAESVLLGVGYSLELTETFTTEDESLTFMYPADSIAMEDEGVGLVLSDDLADLPDIFEPGQFIFGVFDLTAMDMVGEDMDSTTVSFVEALLEEGDEMSDVFTLLINEEDEVKFIAVSNSEGGNEGGAFVIETENGVYGVVFVAAPGRADTISAAALNMLYSINATEEEE